MNSESLWNDETVRSARDGGIAGLLATAPMTAAMLGIHRQLPALDRMRRLPPEQITMTMADKAGIDDNINRDEKKLLTLASHFGYGALSGAAYGVFADRTKLSPLVGGAGFGLAIWAASYLGWLPAMNVRRTAAKESAGTNLMMVASHLVWGVSAALAHQAMREKHK